MVAIRLLALAFLTLLPAHGEKVHVFLVAGQSNATSLTVTGVREVLDAAFSPRRTLVLLSSHGGSPLYRWNLDGTAGPNYSDDLALLKAQMDLVRADGDEPVFEALFWMQGESDCSNSQNIPLYAGRFDAMLEQYRKDLALDQPLPFSLGVTDANADPYYDDPARLGTTRAIVDALRAVQFQLGARENGTCADSRGKPRQDAWHFTGNAALEFGRELAQAYLEKFPLPVVPAAPAELAAANRAFRQADQDGNAVISWEEFLALTLAEKKERALRKKHGSIASELVQYSAWAFFEWFDADASGTIDPEEWLLGRVLDPQEATPDFTLIPAELLDRNADGVRSPGEFKWLARGIVPRERIREWYAAMEK